MILDFSKCKTPEDVAKVYDDNMSEFKSVRQIKNSILDAFPTADGKEEKE